MGLKVVYLFVWLFMKKKRMTVALDLEWQISEGIEQALVISAIWNFDWCVKYLCF